MKKAKKILCIGLILISILQLNAFSPVFAAVNPPQPAPERLRVEAIEPGIRLAIGYNEFDKYYVDLKSDKQKLPTAPPVGSSTYLNYYLQEINKPYKPIKPTALKEGNLPADKDNDNEYRMKELSSGTIYYAYSRAYYTYSVDNTTFTSPESLQSNTVKFMTDIAINAYSYGPNQIKVEWDDVWNSGKRMDYKLYISENKTFSNTPPIYIGQDQIGQNGPVTVNEATGKLEYIHTVRDPGRVYYIKIVPDTTETELKKSDESPTVTVSSFILARTTKMSTADYGTIWRLEWSPVVTGIGDSSVKVSYQIYKGTSGSGALEQYMAAVDDTVFFLTLQPGEETNYYIIKAVVTKNGQDVYPGIKIQSDKIYIKESEVPSSPSVPELVDEFSNSVSTFITYAGELKPDSATILWRAPRKGTGEVDTDITYDIWLVNDPNLIDDPPDNFKIASSLKMSDANFVMPETTLLGYKYTIPNLMSNSTYYFKIVAKKSFVEYDDNNLVNVTYESLPALKVIITPTDGPIDQPIVPGRPPLTIKTINGKDAVTGTTAVIELKNKWYERYVVTNGTGRWEYVLPADLGAALVTQIENGTANAQLYRKVEYDNGVTIDVGCVPFTEGMVYSDLEKLNANKIIGFPVTPNDPLEDPTATGAIPDNKRHNVDITITDLDPNTTYVIWVRAARRNVDLLSGPSDPIIVTTNPDIPPSLEKPTVPVFNYYEAGDVYADLGWNVNPGYNYYLKYATVDDIGSADDSIKITPEELQFVSFYKVTDLKPNTVYYFWIQAEAFNEAEETISSDWSDSLVLKTQPDIPPATPRGFGVKGVEGSVTKDSITYEWIQEDGMEYILQIASDIDYKDATEYNVKEVSEFKVDKLRSNFRYYARLYAYDSTKKLRSEPTQSVTVRTERSNDDFDSDQDIENVISGDYIVKEAAAVNHVWHIRIIGVNADRFIEHVQTDSMLDYRIDLNTTPAGTDRVSLIISNKVFRSLTKLRENLVVETARNMLVIRPGMLEGEEQTGTASKPGEQNYEIGIVLNSTAAGSDVKNLNFKTPVTAVEIGTAEGGSITPSEQLNRPLKVIYTYTTANWYREGATAGYVLAGNSAVWQKAATSAEFDPDSGKGYLSFETLKPGRVAVAEQGTDFYDDIARHWARSAIVNVASVHKLKSIAGRKFEPDKYATTGDMARFALDILDYDYGGDYLTLAVKSGLVSSGDAEKPDSVFTREKAIAMAVRIYEMKTGEKAASTRNDTGVFKDIGQASAALFPAIKFAAESGIIISRFTDTLGPKDPVTRAEIMVLFEKLLKYTGEL